MNRIAFNTVVRTVRINSAARPIVPYRWVSEIFRKKQFEEASVNFNFSNRVMQVVANKDKVPHSLPVLPVALLYSSEVSFLSHEAKHVLGVSSLYQITQYYQR